MLGAAHQCEIMMNVVVGVVILALPPIVAHRTSSSGLEKGAGVVPQVCP